MQPIEIDQLTNIPRNNYPLLRGVGIMLLGIIASFFIFPFIGSIIAAGYIGYDVTKRLNNKNLTTNTKIFLIAIPIQFIGYFIDFTYTLDSNPELKAELEQMLLDEAERTGVNLTLNGVLILGLILISVITFGVWILVSLLGNSIGNSSNLTNKRYGTGNRGGSLRDSNPLYPDRSQGLIQGQTYGHVQIAQQTTKECQYCQTINPDDSKFCIKCGAHILEPIKIPEVKSQTICPACNAPTTSDMLFCGNCGSRLKKQE